MILVTGGTGLVGSHLLCQLALKHSQIRAIYRNQASLNRVKNVFSFYFDKPDLLFNKIEWVAASIEDLPSLTGAFADVDLVYHCAALISFNADDYKQMRRTNITGTANMINLSIDFKIKKFCYVSSIATLEDSPKGIEVTEENGWNGSENKCYAITKYGAEQEVWRGSQEGLEVVIVNPGVIIGPGFWESGSGKLFTTINKGFKFYTLGVTGFVGVYDVVKSMILLMESNLSLERYILVSENLNFKQVFDAIADALKVKKPSIRITKWFSLLVWRLDAVKSFITRKPSLFTRETANSSQHKTYYSSDKIKKALAFEFEPIDRVIKKTAQLFLKNHFNY